MKQSEVLEIVRECNAKGHPTMVVEIVRRLSAARGIAKADTKQRENISKQVHSIIDHLVARRKLASRTLGLIREVLLVPDKRAIKYKCPKCKTVREAKIGHYVSCINAECKGKDGKRHRFWVYPPIPTTTTNKPYDMLNEEENGRINRR